MKKEKVNVGDIFLIPFENQFAVCKVLWISKKTKNVFSFVIKNQLVNLTDDVINVGMNNNNVKISLFTGIVEVFYTNIQKLQEKEWQIIGNIELQDQELNTLLYHNIGGKLFNGDNEIRALKNEELRTIPKMLVAGYDAIYNFLKMAFD